MDVQTKILGLLNRRSEQALREIYAHYGGLCRQVAGRILASPEDVEEVVNDAVFALWNNVPPERPLSLVAYLMRIVRNCAMTRLRNNSAAMRDARRSVSLTELEAFLPTPDSTSSALEYKQLTQSINRFLLSLDERNRDLFVRRFYYLDKPEALAGAFGMSVLAVNTRLTRIRNGLRKHLKGEGLLL